jgi:succinate dehydrogenase/fumarate reductase cytochrome b subunit
LLWSFSSKKERRQVGLGRLSNGERISGVSAILLFIFMFFHWFGVKAVNTSNLLFAVQSIEPGKNAWEALEYIPIVLLITIIVTLAVVALRLTNAVRKFPVPVNALVAILGLLSMLLILYRIVDPPIFYVEITITDDGAAQLPIFLALLAAAGIAFGGCLAIWEEGFSLSKPNDESAPLVRRRSCLAYSRQSIRRIYALKFLSMPSTHSPQFLEYENK